MGMHTMGTVEAGAYLRDCREARGLSVLAVARKLHTSKSQIERIEDGEIDTRSSLIAGFARLVNANANRLFSLLLGEPVPDTDEWWSDFDRLTPEQRHIVIGILREFVTGE